MKNMGSSHISFQFILKSVFTFQFSDIDEKRGTKIEIEKRQKKKTNDFKTG